MCNWTLRLCVSLTRFVFTLLQLGKGIGEPIRQIVSKLNHFLALILDMRVVSIVWHFHHCGSLSRLLEHFLEVNLLQQQLVSFFRVQVILCLYHEKLLGWSRLGWTQQEILDQFSRSSCSSRTQVQHFILWVGNIVFLLFRCCHDKGWLLLFLITTAISFVQIVVKRDLISLKIIDWVFDFLWDVVGFESCRFGWDWTCWVVASIWFAFFGLTIVGSDIDHCGCELIATNW